MVIGIPDIRAQQYRDTGYFWEELQGDGFLGEKSMGYRARNLGINHMRLIAYGHGLFIAKINAHDI